MSDSPQYPLPAFARMFPEETIVAATIPPWQERVIRLIARLEKGDRIIILKQRRQGRHHV